MHNSTLRRIMSAVFALVLAFACAPALVALAAGPSINVEVIGPDADGKPVYYAEPVTYELAEGEDAWTLTQKSLDANGLTYDAENTSYGVMLNSINSPIDGTKLEFNADSGAYWQLFVDGAASEVGISGVEPADGQSIVWYYSAFGDTLPATVGSLATDAAAGNAAAGGFPVAPVLIGAGAAAIIAVVLMRSRKNA